MPVSYTHLDPVSTDENLQFAKLDRIDASFIDFDWSSISFFFTCEVRLGLEAAIYFNRIDFAFLTAMGFCFQTSDNEAKEFCFSGLIEKLCRDNRNRMQFLLSKKYEQNKINRSDQWNSCFVSTDLSVNCIMLLEQT
ncbi:hypothetical protein T4B_7189 [Trichinella pseudospiralis]|uniref:Uncharacterized protein n=1 Tax=Trichinella pseudospiralis TaxID=6337 RepID=A0A0V1JAY2_TRIPS|nr:hypothetical protein T4B_7189 [Trichinella pseudospiralis]